MKQATIFFAAACPSADVHAARVMKHIKAAEPNTEFNFVGFGGLQMAHEGLDEIAGVDSRQFIYKPFFPTKNFYRPATEIAIHPVHMYTRWVNKQVLRKLEKAYFDVIQNSQPSAFITFENEFFMTQFYKKLRDQYHFYNKICPPTFYYGLTQKDQHHLVQNYLDHMFTRVQMKQSNYEKFIFPHTQVGFDGVYCAYRYLLSNSPKYANLVQENQIFLPQGECFRFDEFVSDLVNEQRKAYRKSNSISDSDLVIFVAAGNNHKEIPFILKRVAEGLQKFLGLEEMKNFPKESLKVVIGVPEFLEHQELTRKHISSQKWPVQVSLAETENERFAAMAASDIGLAVNGQIVAECAAFQLPTLVLDSKPIQQMYFTQMYNSFDSDLNIAYEGTVYPELLMQTLPNKIAYSLLEHYQDPKLRYFYAKQYTPILQASLARSLEQVPQEIANKYSSVQLGAYGSAYGTMAKVILKASQTYKDIHHKSYSTMSENDLLRIKALKSLGWAKGF